MSTLASPNIGTHKVIAVLTDAYVDNQRAVIDIIAGIAAEAGYRVVSFAGQELEITDRSEQPNASANEIYQLAKRANIAGIVCVTGGVGRRIDKETLAQFIEGFNVPASCLGIEVPGIPSITGECDKGMYDLMDHVLSDERRQKLAFLRGIEGDCYSRCRETIFRERMLATGRSIDENLFISGNYDSFDAYNATLELLEAHPDVDTIVAANDVMALSAARVATLLGMRIPQDIAITGFDDSIEATEHSPALTTVRQHMANMAGAAIGQLLELMHKGPESAGVALLTEMPSDLVVRGSTTTSNNQKHSDHKATISNRLTEALCGIETPEEISLAEVASDVELALTRGHEHLADCLEQLQSRCIETRHIQWLRVLCYQIEQLMTKALQSSGRDAEISSFIGTLSPLRENIWARTLSSVFEERRMYEARSSLQVQIGSSNCKEDLLSALDRWLAITRPQQFYLVHYDTQTSGIPEQARLLRAAYAGQPHAHDDQPFRTAELLPQTLQEELEGDQLVLFPIFAGSLHFGYMMIDPEGIENMSLDDAASSIGNALRNQYMIQTLQQQTRALQYTNDELHSLANFDALTKLPNRRQLEGNLTRACEQLSNNTGQFSVAFLDLDGFKLINDTLGHEIGDQLLQQVADRLRVTTHCLAADKNIIARLGGDEFILLVHSADDDEMNKLGAALLDSLSHPFQLSNQTVNISASIGFACAPEDGKTPSELLKAADAAMYDAKARGKNRHIRFRQELISVDAHNLGLAQALRGAIKDKELVMHYQPRVDLKTQQVCGVEALMRWIIDTPEGPRQMAGPHEFIPVAERSGLIDQLDTFALFESCRQAKEWAKAGLRLPVSVNVSVMQLQQSNFVCLVKSALQKYQLDSSLLELEVTESAAMTDVESNIIKLGELRDLGIHVSIDDFGTGHSSLNYLKRLPADTLKIDRAFVKDIDGSSDIDSPDVAIIRSIVAVANTMRFGLVAEGIETPDQQAFLAALGCHEGQGYLFGKPQAAEGIYGLLRKGGVKTAA